MSASIENYLQNLYKKDLHFSETFFILLTTNSCKFFIAHHFPPEILFIYNFSCITQYNSSLTFMPSRGRYCYSLMIIILEYLLVKCKFFLERFISWVTNESYVCDLTQRFLKWKLLYVCHRQISWTVNKTDPSRLVNETRDLGEAERDLEGV